MKCASHPKSVMTRKDMLTTGAHSRTAALAPSWHAKI